MIRIIIAVMLCITVAVHAGQKQPPPAPPVDPYSKAAYVPAPAQSGMTYTADVCIVGAGFAGVKAAEQVQVQSNGTTSWLLIETQDRIGGRVDTVTIGTGANQYKVEKHAQWLQGDHRMPILALAKELDPPLGGGHSLWEDYDYYDATGAKRGYNSGSSLGQALINLYSAYDCVYGEMVPKILSGELQDMSLRDCYATCGFYPRTAEEYSMESALIAVEWGELSDVTSCGNSGQWVAYSFYGNDAEDTANFVADPRGLAAVVKHILLRKGIQLNDTRIHLNTRVSNINTDTNVITATRGNNPVKYGCKTIINTISIGAYQASLRNNTNLVTPVPPLAKQVSFHKYHMGFYRKVFLQFNTKFWGDKAHFAMTNNDTGLQVNSWTSMDHPRYYPGSKILLGSHNGPESNMYANMPDHVYVKKICDELVKVFGPAASFENLTANGYFVSNDVWDEDLRGAYSNRPPTLSSAEFRAMWEPVKGRYFPSGEASCDLLNGYVVGAYFSGQTAALRALRNLGVIPETVNPEDNECYRPPYGWVA